MGAGTDPHWRPPSPSRKREGPGRKGHRRVSPRGESPPHPPPACGRGYAWCDGRPSNCNHFGSAAERERRGWVHSACPHPLCFRPCRPTCPHPAPPVLDGQPIPRLRRYAGRPRRQSGGCMSAANSPTGWTRSPLTCPAALPSSAAARSRSSTRCSARRPSISRWRAATAPNAAAPRTAIASPKSPSIWPPPPTRCAQWPKPTTCISKPRASALASTIVATPTRSRSPCEKPPPSQSATG